MPTAASIDAASVTASVLFSPALISGTEGSRGVLSGPSSSLTAVVTSCRAAACAVGASAAGALAGSRWESVRKEAMLLIVGWSKACTTSRAAQHSA